MIDEWKTIDTAPTDRRILLAHITKEYDGEYIDYVTIAEWTHVPLGYAHKASVTGWWTDSVPLVSDYTRNRSGTERKVSFLPTDPYYAPTHWRDFE